LKALKELREASGKTQAQMAAMLSTTQQTYARWEGGKASPPISALQQLASVFSTTVDHLLGRATPKASNTHHHTIAQDVDEFWGHLGLLMPGTSQTRWYPIVAREASEIRRKLAGGYNVDDWIIAYTLNNRVLIFAPKKMQRVWLLDDLCDSPEGDWHWNGPLKDCEGIPIQIYKAMDDWLHGKQEFETNNSKAVREEALNMIEEAGFADCPDKLRAYLRDTTIHLTDGGEISYQVEQTDLSLLHTELEGDTDIEIVTISLSEGSGESYYPTHMLRLIDMPLLELEAGLAELDD
jgi:transcriptional regulator with XRE-family HTH domain